MWEPTGNRILIEMIGKKENVSAGGIVLEARADKDTDSDEAVVVKIGPLAFSDQGDGQPWCKVGDRILTQKYPGKMAPEAGKMLRVIDDIQVLAIKAE